MEGGEGLWGGCVGGEQNTVGQDRTEQDSAGWVLLFKIKAKGIDAHAC